MNAWRSGVKSLTNPEVAVHPQRLAGHVRLVEALPAKGHVALLTVVLRLHLSALLTHLFSLIDLLFLRVFSLP